MMELEREATENKLTLNQNMVRNAEWSDIRFQNVLLRYSSRVTVFDKLSLNSISEQQV